MLQFGEFPAVDRGAGDQHEVATGGNEGLMPAKNLAQAALGASTGDGIADLRKRGDEADAGGR